MVMSWTRVSVFVGGAAIAAAGMAYYTGMLDSYFVERQQVVAQIADETVEDASLSQDGNDIEPDDAVMRVEEAEPAAAADEAAIASDSEPVAEGSGADEDGKPGESADLIVPAFDLLRVEPDGGMVVAGRAAPGSDVEIQTGDSILAVTKSGVDGDFAAVLDEPLEPGDYQLVLRATGEDEVVVTSRQTALVSIPETLEGDVLALVDEPGEPARLITVPAAEKDEPETAEEPIAEPVESEIAQVQPVEPEHESDAAAQDVDDETLELAADLEAGASEEPDLSLADGEIDMAALQDDAGAELPDDLQAEDEQEREIAATGGDDVEELDEVAERPAANDETLEPAPDLQAGEATVEDEAIAGQEDEAGDLAGAEIDDVPGGEAEAKEETEFSLADGEIDMAALQDDAAPEVTENLQAEPEPEGEIAATGGDVVEERPAAEAGPGVVVDAVEIEGDRIFVAGRATPGHTVRVYANSDLLGDGAVTPGGTFLVDVRRNLAVGDYIIRADLLDGEGAVLARAAVPFSREEGEMVAAVAPHLVEDGGEEELESEALPDADIEADSPSIADGRQDMEDEPSQAGPELEATAQPEVGQDIEAEAAEESHTAIAAAPAEPAASAQSGASEEAEADRGEAVQRASEPAPAAATDHAAFAPADVIAEPLERVDGSVIIRRGDTLWHISRRVYGKGIRYSTIYIANQDQIRDPDLIWPGQIFAVPGETVEGEPADLGVLEERAAEAEPGEAG